MLEKILGDLWRFRSQLDGLHHPCNGYLLRMGRRWILIDPPEDLLPQTVRPLLGKGEITDIYITHLQHEHAAGAAHFPKAVLHVPHGDEYLCKGEEAYRAKIRKSMASDPWEANGNYQGHLAGACNERPLRTAIPLGDSLYPGNVVDGMQVMATPGHGKSAVTLLAEVDGQRVAFCGDLIYSGGRLWNWFDCDWDYGLETGQRTLLQSARRLRDAKPDLLCPSHGDLCQDAVGDLSHLVMNLDAVLSLREATPPAPINFPEPKEKAPGWRELTPHLYQWKAGNMILLLSGDGHAMAIDAGFCGRQPAVKTPDPDTLFQGIKKALGIRSIEWVVPTNYQYDHWNLVSHLIRAERAKVLSLDTVTGPIQNPHHYNLARSQSEARSNQESLSIDMCLTDGETFSWRGYNLRFFHLGGDTWYQLGIQIELDGSRVLLVGDAMKGAALTAGPVLCWNDAEPEEKGSLFALRKISERKPDLLVGGHGTALRQPMRYVKACLSDWLGRVAILEKLNPRASASAFFSPFYTGS